MIFMIKENSSRCIKHSYVNSRIQLASANFTKYSFYHFTIVVSTPFSILCNKWCGLYCLW